MNTPSERLSEMDICSNRHNGNEQSEEANHKVCKEVDREFIYVFIEQHKIGYSKQLARVMNKGLNCISGRFSELKEDNRIVDTGERKEGCAVYRIKDVWDLF
jgi:hypothetical protein